MRDDDIKIAIEVKELRDRLMANRAEHERQYIEASEGFRQAAIKELGKRARAFKAGDPDVSLYFDLTRPRSYVDDFDSVLAMLDYHTLPDIELDRENFEKYVLNKWDWMPNFQRVHTTYTSR